MAFQEVKRLQETASMPQTEDHVIMAGLLEHISAAGMVWVTEPVPMISQGIITSVSQEQLCRISLLATSSMYNYITGEDKWLYWLDFHFKWFTIYIKLTAGRVKDTYSWKCISPPNTITEIYRHLCTHDWEGRTLLTPSCSLCKEMATKL